MGECPAPRSGAGCASFVAWCSSLPWLAAACSEGQAVLPKVMHQLHRPSPWLGEYWHSLDLKAWLLWGRENSFPGWTGDCVGWCVPLHNCYTKEGAVLGPTMPCLLPDCELSGTS